MLENRGQLSRRLVQLRSESSDANLSPGDKLFSEDGRRVGEVTGFLRREKGGQLAMAYLKKGYFAPGSTVIAHDKSWEVAAIVGESTKAT